MITRENVIKLYEGLFVTGAAILRRGSGGLRGDEMGECTRTGGESQLGDGFEALFKRLPLTLQGAAKYSCNLNIF